MNKYKKIISKLKVQGISFETGMSSFEISEAEKRYCIHFPDELKYFYSIGLPVSRGFFNWRSRNTDNINLIKKALEQPLKGLEYDLNYEDFWNEDWGAKPLKIKEANKVLLKHYNNAPKMIPIYSHRYMPFIPNDTNIPIFSIYQSDIILYGENLISYFEIEFGLKTYNDLVQAEFQHIDFWSDLL